jgi:GT2 family glycosyltransferase
MLGCGDIPFVTVVVPVYNEKAHIAECLQSLIQSDYPKDHFEVLVLEGGSNDGSQHIVMQLARQSSLIRLLDNPHRIAAAGMNIGVQNATGDVIIVLSAHSYVASDFISQSVLYLSKTGAACVGGPMHSVAESFVGKSISLAMSSPFGVGNALFRHSRKAQYVDTVAFGAYRREVFWQIGLFDEELACNEDDEFNYRLRAQGGRIFLSPAIESWYYTRTSLAQLWRQYYRYGLGKVTVIQRHPRSAMVRQFVPFTLISTLMVSGSLGILHPVFLWLFLSVLASYLTASVLFSARISARSGWKYLPVLPAAFACLHFGYGAGFLVGLLRLVGRSARRLLPRNAGAETNDAADERSGAGSEAEKEPPIGG